MDFIPPSIAHLLRRCRHKGRRSSVSCTPRYSRRVFASSEGGNDQKQQGDAAVSREGVAAPKIAPLFAPQSISKSLKLHFATFDSGNSLGFGKMTPESFQNVPRLLKGDVTSETCGGG